MSISDFANGVNLPTCNYVDQFSTLTTKSTKTKLTFLMGHPTFYGLYDLSMPKKGYEILEKHTRVQANHGYCLSSGLVKARQAVLKLYKPKISIDTSSVFINHRVNMGMLNILMAFVNPGDQILIPEMGYPFFTDICPAMKVKAIPYKLRKDKNFEIDLEDAQKLVNQKTQFIFVINPTNPMGSVFSEEHMKDVISFADKNQLPIVADQVHIRQTFPKYSHKSFGQITVDVPVIVLCGLEKAFSVPGWSTSWTIVFDRHGYLKNIVSNLGVLCTIFLHTNRMTQEALPELIETLGIFTHDKMHLIEQKHDYAFEKASKMSGIKPLKAQGTVYLLLELCLEYFKEIKSDKQFVRLLFEQENVSILPLSIFGTGIEGMRLMTLASELYYNEFFQRLEVFINRHKK